MSKTLKTRIQNKHDVEANWNLATNFSPLAGEMIIYDPDENYAYPRFKIGDGETNVNQLDFIADSIKNDEINTVCTGVLSVSELVEKYNFNYYSSLNLAIADVNNSTTENADSNNINAVAGVYTDENSKTVVVLMKDTTETSTITATKDMTLNLGSHCLSLGTGAKLQFTNTITEAIIDGRLPNSKIEKILTAASSTAEILIDAACTNFNIIGGFYKLDFLSAGNSVTIKVGSGVISNISNCIIEGKSESGRIRPIQSQSVLTLKNCTINGESINGVVQSVFAITSTTIQNCIINSYSTNEDSSGIFLNPNSAEAAKIENCYIVAGSKTSQANGVYLHPHTEASATVSNCNIKAYSDASVCYGILNHSTFIINDCDIFADATSVQSTGTFSNGIQSSADSTLTINSATVYGTHSGLTVHGNLYINGGIFKGTGHGGVYFSSDNKTVYIKNAKIINSPYIGNYGDAFVMDNQYMEGGFYVGGGNNISVYMNSCEVIGAGGNPFILRNTTGEQNNTLYISNSDISGNQKIRIDDNTMKVYIGKGCNFTANNTNLPTSVIRTNEIYIEN